MKLIPKRLLAVVTAAAGLITLGWLASRQAQLASTPTDLSGRSWKKALLETKQALADKHLSIYAAGISYFATLAFFPLMVAMVAISALLISSSEIDKILAVVNQYAPRDLAGLVSAQLENATDNQSSNLVMAVLAIILSLISVSGAAQNMIQALNVAYSTKESRGFIRLRLVSLAVTGGIIVVISLSLALLIFNPFILVSIGLPAGLAAIYPVLRWVMLVVLILVAMAVLYRYAPDRAKPQWQWVSWGSLIATIAWMIATVLLFVYVQRFANFSDTYSLFAGIIILMMWLNVSALIVLIGAEVNRRLESKTIYPTSDY